MNLYINIVTTIVAMVTCVCSIICARVAINTVDELDLRWRRFRQATRRLAADRDRRMRRGYYA